jgi:hypothetical protein
MRSFVACSLALALAAVAVAGELKSGPQPDQAIGPFDVVKCGGGTDDDVSVGEQLCYRCRYGNRPMVMVFTRTVNDTVAALTSKLNEEVAEHKDAKLSAFVNLIGDDNREPLEAQAKDLAKKAKAAHVPVVVPVESANGPEDYSLNPKAEVTVILAVRGKVKASLAFESGKLDEKAVDAILEQVDALVE